MLNQPLPRRIEGDGTDLIPFFKIIYLEKEVEFDYFAVEFVAVVEVTCL